MYANKPLRLPAKTSLWVNSTGTLRAGGSQRRVHVGVVLVEVQFARVGRYGAGLTLGVGVAEGRASIEQYLALGRRFAGLLLGGQGPSGQGLGSNKGAIHQILERIGSIRKQPIVSFTGVPQAALARQVPAIPVTRLSYLKF